MSKTSASLLDRLQSDPQSDSWQRLVDIYTPLIRHWLRRQNFPVGECEDLVQDVMAVVIRRLPEFQHNQRLGAFRTWLRSITANCVFDYFRTRKKTPLATGDTKFVADLQELQDPNSGISQAWDREHNLFVTKALLEILRPSFEEKTWTAFERFALQGESAASVAAALGMSANAVFIAKSKILSRLREEAAGLLDD